MEETSKNNETAQLGIAVSIRLVRDFKAANLSHAKKFTKRKQ